MAGVTGYDILQFLSEAGKLGFPFSNMAHNDLQETEPLAYLDTLRSLERKGFIKFSGPRTLSDFAGLIEEKSSLLVSAAEQDGQSKDNHHHLFRDDHNFFMTNIRPTLRGLFALGLHKLDKDKLAETLTVEDKPKPFPEPNEALAALIAKREEEARKKEEGRPLKAFEEVINSLARGEDKDAKNWGYATEYLDQLEWDTLAAHKRLVDTNSDYRRAFGDFKRAGKKIGVIMESTAAKLQFGDNPFNGLILSAVFGMVARPISAYKFKHGLDAMKEIFFADRGNASAQPTVAPTPGPT